MLMWDEDRWAGSVLSGTRRGGVWLSLLAVGVLWMLAPVASAAACDTGVVAYTYTGTEQCYVVTGGVSSVQVVAIGAPGGGAGSGQGFGAVVGAVVPVSSGETLYVAVGGAGTMSGKGAAPGGFNGGGAGGAPSPTAFGGSGDGGGGASDVRSVSVSTSTELSLGSRLLVAGGGGGATPSFSGISGVGGNADGLGSGIFGGMGGAAGGVGGGGLGGDSATCSPGAANMGVAGAVGQGGAGGVGVPAGGTNGGTNGGGGGGGGYFGGGGGQGGTGANLGCQSAGGGGGGGSYVTPFASAASYATDSTGVPSVTITPQTATALGGSRGPARKIVLVVCKAVTKTVTTHGHKHKVAVQKCAAKLVSGTVKFKINGHDLGATIARAGVTYATGLASRGSAGRWRVLLTRDIHKLRPGRYTLTLRTRHARRRIVERRTITIT